MEVNCESTDETKLTENTSTFNRHVSTSEYKHDTENASSSSDNESINTQSDPLHDPEADDQDEEWVLANLLESTTIDGDKNHTNITNPISCSRCFATLSLQSQPHETFEGQFRAVAVLNTRIDASCRIRVKDDNGVNQDDKNDYLPVVCNICGGHVGAKDKHDVYHFFNVIYGDAV